MSKVLPNHTTAFNRTLSINQSLALRSVGARHSRTFSPRSRKPEVPACRHRLFYQMGGSRSLEIHRPKRSQTIPMEKCCDSFWNLEVIDLRQWNPVQELGHRRFLHQVRHQATLLQRRVPSRKQEGRSLKQGHPRWTQALTRSCKREMG